MKKRKYENKLFIDMPFGKAVERFAGVEPQELKANLERGKKKKRPPGGKPSEGSSQNVVRLRDRRKAHNVR